MKVKGTLYIQKTIWIEEEVEVEVANPSDADSIDAAIIAAFDNWYDSQEDAKDPTTDYELDDWGWELIEEEVCGE